MRLFKFGFGAIVSLTVFTWLPIASPETVMAAELDLRRKAFAANCVICDACGGGHVAPESAVGLRTKPAHNDCLVGTCAEHHPTNCVVENDLRDDFATTWSEAASASGDELRRLLADGAEGTVKTLYNEKRQAIQFFGCNGNLIANLPLSIYQLESLNQ
jgi:hypothetical protein